MLLPVAICNFIKMDGLGRVVTVVSAEQSDNAEVSSFSEQLQISDIKVDDYILVRFTTKLTEKFYIGQMMEMDKKKKRNTYNNYDSNEISHAGASCHKKNIFFNFIFVKRCLELRNYFAFVTEGT